LTCLQALAPGLPSKYDPALPGYRPSPEVRLT